MNAGNKKHTQHAPSTKTECDYFNGWIKKRSHTQKSHPKVVNPRDIAGERKKKKKKKICASVFVCGGMEGWDRRGKEGVGSAAGGGGGGGGSVGR